MEKSTESIDSCSTISSSSTSSNHSNMQDTFLMPEYWTDETLSEMQSKENEEWPKHRLKGELRATKTFEGIDDFKDQRRLGARTPVKTGTVPSGMAQIDYSQFLLPNIKPEEAQKLSDVAVTDQGSGRLTIDSAISEIERSQLQLIKMRQLVEQKDQELSGLVKIRLQQRQAEERCTRCGEFVVQIVHLKTKQKKYKEKKRAQQQECQRLQNQLDASRATVILWENATKNVEQHRTREKEEEKAAVEKIKKLEIDNGALAEKIAELEQQFKNVEQHRAHEEEEKKATVEKLKKLEIENRAQVGKIAELEQQVEKLKNSFESTKRRSLNQQRIHNDLVNQLDDESDQKKVALDEANAKLVTATAERDAANGELVKVGAERDAANGELVKVGAERDAANGELVKVGAERDAANGELAKVGAERDAANGELAKVGAERDAANGELVRTRTQANRLRLHNGLLQHLVDQFQGRLQDYEHREQNGQALRDELLEIIVGLDNYNQQPDGPTIGGLDNYNQQPDGPTDIFALRAEAEVHNPD